MLQIYVPVPGITRHKRGHPVSLWIALLLEKHPEISPPGYAGRDLFPRAASGRFYNVLEPNADPRAWRCVSPSFPLFPIRSSTRFGRAENFPDFQVTDGSGGLNKRVPV